MKVYNLWSFERRLQLVVSQSIIDEYLETLERVIDEPRLIAPFRARLQNSPTVTRINLGKRFRFSRDPDDDILLATAHTGHARYLVSNVRDLIEVPAKDGRGFRFEIVKPAQLLQTAERDYGSLTKRCAAFDAQLMDDMTKAGGARYALDIALPIVLDLPGTVRLAHRLDPLDERGRTAPGRDG